MTLLVQLFLPSGKFSKSQRDLKGSFFGRRDIMECVELEKQQIRINKWTLRDELLQVSLVYSVQAGSSARAAAAPVVAMLNLLKLPFHT